MKKPRRESLRRGFFRLKLKSDFNKGFSGQGFLGGTVKVMNPVIGFWSVAKSEVGNSHCRAAAIAS
jgi:hypothetical protein